MARRKWLIGAGGVVAVGAAMIAAALFMLGAHAPQSVSLAAAVAAGSSTSTTQRTSQTTSGLAGTWNVVDDGSSFVGYRVQEELAGIGSTTAVGRTTAVDGTLEFDGTHIKAVTVQAD